MNPAFQASMNPYPQAPTAVPNGQQVVIPQITIPQPLQNYYQTPGVPNQLTNPQTTLPNAYDVPGPQLLKTATGIDGVKQYPTVANASYAIFAEDDDVFWVKTTDKNNYPVSLRRFRFYEEEEPVPVVEETVSKADYDKLLNEIHAMRDEIHSMKEERANGQQPVRNNQQNTNRSNGGQQSGH